MLLRYVGVMFLRFVGESLSFGVSGFDSMFGIDIVVRLLCVSIGLFGRYLNMFVCSCVSVLGSCMMCVCWLISVL